MIQNHHRNLNKNFLQKHTLRLRFLVKFFIFVLGLVALALGVLNCTNSQPEISPSPLPDNSPSPSPDNSLSPLPDNSLSPLPDNSLSPLPDNSLSPQTLPEIISKEGEFQAKFEYCQLQSDELQCSFLVKNTEQEKTRLGVYLSSSSNSFRTRMIISGDEYIPKTLKFGTEKTDAIFVENILEKGTSLRISLSFNDVITKETAISKLSIICYDIDNKKTFDFNFENLPISRQ